MDSKVFKSHGPRCSLLQQSKSEYLVVFGCSVKKPTTRNKGSKLLSTLRLLELSINWLANVLATCREVLNQFQAL